MVHRRRLTIAVLAAAVPVLVVIGILLSRGVPAPSGSPDVRRSSETTGKEGAVAEPTDAPMGVPAVGSVHLDEGPFLVEGRVWLDGAPVESTVEVFRMREPSTPADQTRALLGLADERARPIASVRSKGTGGFRCSGLAAGVLAFRAEAGGRVGTDWTRLPGEQGVPSVEITLSGGDETIRGIALLADGTPFVGRIWVDADPFLMIASNADGRFRLEGLAPGLRGLNFLVPGKALYCREVTVPLDEDLRIVLDVGFVVLAGRVVDDGNDRPVPGATLCWSHRQDAIWHSANAVADAQGRFRFRAPPGRLRTAVGAEGYVDAIAFLDERVGDLEIRLVPEPTIVGRVVAAADGGPVAGVAVFWRLHGVARPTGPPRGRTDEDGRFVLAGVEPGVADVWVDGDGWVSEDLAEDLSSREYQPLRFDLSGAAEIAIRVVRAGRAEGRVLDASGRPVFGALVSASFTHPARRSNSAPAYDHRVHAATDAHGAFVFGTLVPGVPIDLLARSREGIEVEGGPLRVGSGETVRVDLRLPRPRWIALTVTDAESGAPVAVAGVTVRQQEGRQWHFTTDDEGKARLGPLQPGPLNIRVDHGRYLCPEAGTDVAADGPDEIAVSLRRGLDIAGRVLWPDGTPAGRGYASLESDQVGERHAGEFLGDMDVDGRFRLGPVPAGSWEVHVYAYRVDEPAGESRIRVDLEAGRDDHVIRLPEPDPFEMEEPPPEVEEVDLGTLVIRCVGPDGGPVRDGLVEVVDGDHFWIGDDGKVELPLQDRERPLRIVVTRTRDAAGVPLGPAVLEGVRPRAGEVVVRVPSGRTISGRVLREDGRGARGVEIRAWPVARDGLPERASAWTGDGGRFLLRGLGDGEYRLQARVSPRHASPGQVRATAGAEDVEIRLAPGATLALRVIPPDGKTPVEAEVRIVSVTDRSRRRHETTGEDGRVRFESLPAGSVHDVRVFGEAGGTVAVVRGVRTGGAPIEIRLRPGAVIRGRVHAPEDVQDVTIWAILEGKRIHVMTTDVEFALRGLTPEVWPIQASGRRPDGKTWSSAKVEVRAPGVVELR